MGSQTQSNGLSPSALRFLQRGTSKVTEGNNIKPRPKSELTLPSQVPERSKWSWRLPTLEFESSSIGSTSDRSSLGQEVDSQCPWLLGARRSKSLSGTPNRGLYKKRKSSELLGKWTKVEKKICPNTLTTYLTQNDAGHNEELLRMTSTLSQLLWTTQHLKHNPVKTNDALLHTLNMLCGGLQELLPVLSRMHLSDIQYRQLLQVTEAFFQLIQSENGCNLPFIVVKIHGKAEDVFDSFLDNFGCPDANAEGQLHGYAICSALIPYISEGEVRKIFMEGLFNRIHRIVGKMLKASRCKQEDSLMEHDKINLLYFYCQLLEKTITSANVEQPWIEKRFYHNVLWIIENAGSLFVMFPNLSYIFFGILNSVKQCIKIEQPVQMPGFSWLGVSLR